MLTNKSDENDIVKFPQNYNLFQHIYFDSPNVYLSIISAKTIDKIVNKIYRQIKYHRDWQYSKHIIFLTYVTVY